MIEIRKMYLLTLLHSPALRWQKSTGHVLIFQQANPVDCGSGHISPCDASVPQFSKELITSEISAYQLTKYATDLKPSVELLILRSTEGDGARFRFDKPLRESPKYVVNTARITNPPTT